MFGFALAVLVSFTGPTMDDVALQAHPAATRYTKLLNAELCGEFVQTDSGYRLDLVASPDRTQCKFRRQEGGTGVIFHTHPADAPTRFAEDDYALPGYLSHPRSGVIFQNGKGTERSVSTP